MHAASFLARSVPGMNVGAMEIKHSTTCPASCSS